VNPIVRPRVSIRAAVPAAGMAQASQQTPKVEGLSPEILCKSFQTRMQTTKSNMHLATNSNFAIYDLSSRCAIYRDRHESNCI